MPTLIKELIFMGTGPSSNLPNVTCLIRRTKPCQVCQSTLTPAGKKNRRNNTSLLIKVLNLEGRSKNILIDCGKTFYASSLEWFHKYNIQTVDAVILTHGHADAIMGLDDLRPWSNLATSGSIPIYLSTETMKVVGSIFPYLVDTSKATGGGEVSALSFHNIDPQTPFVVEGLEFLPLEVEHGFQGSQPFMCLGFRFQDISYISDVSRIPEATRQRIVGSKFLVLDCLKYEPYSSHFGLQQAINETRLINPKQTFLVGLSHALDHYELEDQLHSLKLADNLAIAPAYDGLRLELDQDGNLLELI